ncbi:MAG TPA: VWA domain-containing protein [Terracidiphilus sp.]|nr:VWA domain-containing protein [Terracidiphilus sp.]
MRTPVLGLALLCVVSPAFATRSVSVSQLTQELVALKAKPDKDAAYAIGDMRLTERLGAAQVAELQKGLQGGQSRAALVAIAALSGFMPPSAGEIPSQPAPDVTEQKRILGLFVAYVSKTIPQLPNFLAERVTAHFEDTPLVQSPQGGFIPYEPVHYLETNKVGVHYQDGRETVQSESKVSAKAAAKGLSTRGVFGPILGVVLMDAAHSQLGWGRWEQGQHGVLAVFRFDVPKEKSHYDVDYCCVVEQAGSVAGNEFPFRKIVGYHGEIAVDPATGEARRLVLQAELKSDDPVSKAGILVDYAAVEIGGKTYNCPVHSVSYVLAQKVQVDPYYHFALANQIQPLMNLVTDAVFQKYQVFRSESKILTAADGNLPPVGGQPAAASPPAADSPAGTAVAAQPSAATSAPAGTNAAATPAVAASAEAPRPEPPPTPEIVTSAPSDLPDLENSPQGPANTGFTLRTTSRLVDVAVAAFDKKGRPITDLKAGDIQIFDNGRPQQVKFFNQAGEGVVTAASSAPQPAGTEDAVTNRPIAETSAAGAAQQANPGNTVVLMIDASHVSWADLSYARGEMQRFLKTVPADERVGLYIMKSYGFQVLQEPVADHALIAATLAKWMPSAQDLAHANDEEQRNRQHFDWVHRASDLAYVNGNGEGGNDPEMWASGTGVGKALANPPDAELRPLGDRPEDFALHLLLGVGRHLAAIPGHKTLVWIASDNVLADWSSSAVGKEDNGNRFLDSAAMRARETLNEALVSIYPLDVSQLEAGGISADLGNRNVQALDPALPGEPPPPEKVKENGRDMATMHQDTHPIQGVFRDLAAATGGRALRRAGDIAAELDSIVADGRAAYLLGFTPDSQADGKYHAITVKTSRPGVTLRYRTGYFYSEEPATMKDRLREAVWQPQETNEIGLVALPARGPKGPAVKLSIAATDLEMAQQGDRYTDKVDVFLVVRDDSALHAAVAGKRLGLALKPATYQQAMKDGIPVEQSLPKVPEGMSMRLVVIDENSRRMGTVTLNGSD